MNSTYCQCAQSANS